MRAYCNKHKHQRIVIFLIYQQYVGCKMALTKLFQTTTEFVVFVHSR